MKLFFRKYGEGQPLIILHGLYGSSDNWVTIAKKISTCFTVYIPDQRNHGNSPHSSVNDYQSMCSDLYEFAEDLRLGSFFLTGHSMGGRTAMLFALKWPEMIKGLLVADIPPFSDSKNRRNIICEHHKILNAIKSVDLSKLSSRNEVDSVLSHFITSEKERGMIMKNLKRDENGNFSWKLNADALYSNLGEIVDGLKLNADQLRPVSGFPVVFLKGENSHYISPEDVGDIRKLFPSAEVKIVKRAGHWVHTDNPNAVAEALFGLACQSK
ncbi:MAG: alpha/beta fold hydrolase [Bacteroidales bacterium]|jgi:pimeloyl-ACP methyl ester carboxylesterase